MFGQKKKKIINEEPVERCPIQITAPRLKVFHATFHSVWCSSITVFSNELQDFVWYGYPATPCYPLLDVHSHLQRAAIYLTPNPANFETAFDGSRLGLCYLVNSMRMAKLLRLNVETIKLFNNAEELPSGLAQIRSIAIDYCSLSDNQVPSIAFFLKGLSKLRVLCVSSSSSYSRPSSDKDKRCGFGMEYWVSEDMMFVGGLEEARVQIKRDKGNDVELAKYILKHAKHLRRMDIICRPRFKSKIKAELATYKAESMLFSSVSQV